MNKLDWKKAKVANMKILEQVVWRHASLEENT